MTALVKIGGSVLTDKSRIFSAHAHDSAILAEDIRLSGVIPIVVHGTGSYGKAFARHYSRPGHWSNDAMVFQMTMGRIRHLQEGLLCAFRDAGVPCCPLSTNALFYRDNGRLEMYSATPLRRLLACGVAPVLCGDILVDGSEHFGIVSSDAILAAVARVSKVDDCVFATDVDGICDEGGQVLSQLAAGEVMFSHDSDRLDVTGGMQAKVAAAREIASYGAWTTIVNGRVPGRVRDALTRRPVVGTRVVVADTAPDGRQACAPTLL